MAEARLINQSIMNAPVNDANTSHVMTPQDDSVGTEKSDTDSGMLLVHVLSDISNFATRLPQSYVQVCK